MAQPAVGNPQHASVSFSDFEVRQKSKLLEYLACKARDEQDEDVRTIRGFFFGDQCTEPIMVHVPAAMDDYPSVDTASLRPEVWFSPEVDNDWNAIPLVINWSETSITELHGTKLSCGFTIFTEETTVGKPNAVIYRLSNGHPWFGNVLVMRQYEDDEDQVESMEDHDLQAVENVVTSMAIYNLIPQREQV